MVFGVSVRGCGVWLWFLVFLYFVLLWGGVSFWVFPGTSFLWVSWRRFLVLVCGVAVGLGLSVVLWWVFAVEVGFGISCAFGGWGFRFRFCGMFRCCLRISFLCGVGII